ncbi:MAG: efflux RND transporter permease subunit [Pseudomonadota bacterium]|nr:efflux RND transporter permease subunit [Pseudomonadota bacterium]
MRFARSLISNHPLANILFATVIVLGLLAYLRMPREQDPEIGFNWINISTVLPGASAQDVEAQVTNPLEDALRNVQDVRWVISTSRAGVSSIIVRFDDMPEREFDKRINDVRREVQNQANAELPAEAVDPQIFELTTSSAFPTAVLVLTGQADDETLRSAARKIREDLAQIPGVDRVQALGFQEPEIQVDFDPAALAARGIVATRLSDALRGWFRDVFAGTVETRDGEWLVRVSGTSPDPERVARFRVPPAAGGAEAGAGVPIDAIAEVRRGREEPRQLAATNGQPAVYLPVLKVGFTNTLELVDAIGDYVEKENVALAGRGLQLRLADDQTVATRGALGVMQSNGLIGLLLVMLVCWLFLGARIAAMVALGVVFSIAGTFAILQATGSSLNVSVLLGVVIVLGMLVDDAVVVVEAMYYRIQRGMAGLEAAIESLSEVGRPVLAAVSTTVAAFLPLMLLPGILGKFMFIIPFVVTVGLVVSLVEAFWMLPAHVHAMGPRAISRSRNQELRVRYTRKVRLIYARWLIRVMRRPLPWLAGVGALLLAAILAIGAGAVRVEFFAFDPLRIYYVNVDMPPSASLQDTMAQTQRVEARVRRNLLPDEERSVVSLAGIRFTETEPLYGDRYGQITVSLNPADEDLRSLDEIIDGMRKDVASTPGPAEVSFLRLSGGPPGGRGLSVKVRADDLEQLRAAADTVRALVARIPGTFDITDDDAPGRDELDLQVDVDAALRAGLDPGEVARLVRLHLDGEIVADMRDRGEKVELRVRARPREALVVSDILSDPVALPGGGTTTLGALVHAQSRTSPGMIRHWNLRRAITVEASLDPEAINTVEATRQLREAWNRVRVDHPGADLDLSGELDDINESLSAMGPLALLGIGLIYLILAAQFRSYFQPLLILVTVPLAFIGVTLGLLISGNPLSLYTMYGVIALIGIAVNAAIVLISAANDRRAAGMRTLHATIFAARRRVIAVLMTTATTIAGLFSLAFGIGGKSLLWGPVASSIVWGLAFSAVLTLFVVPVLYRYFMRQRPAA